MKNKAIVYSFAGILAACFICGATGTVKLARVDAEGVSAQAKDRLIGIFVTFDYLDLFDFEQYLEDNVDKVVASGGNLTVDRQKAAAYSDRLYATMVEKSLTNPKTGKTRTMQEYVFEGIEGILYYEALMEDEAGSYYTSGGDDAISDGHIHIKSTDAGDSIEMKGTIYMSALGTENCLYFNPVYQTSEGEVYAVSGNSYSYSYSGEIGGEGVIGTVKLEEKNTVAIDGQTSEVGTLIEMSYAFMDVPVKIIVTQMDHQNQIVGRDEYVPEEMPEKVTAADSTEYILVETIKKDKAGKEIVTRELCQKDEGSFRTFYAREDGICVEKQTEVEWKK